MRFFLLQKLNSPVHFEKIPLDSILIPLFPCPHQLCLYKNKRTYNEGFLTPGPAGPYADHKIDKLFPEVPKTRNFSWIEYFTITERLLEWKRSDKNVSRELEADVTHVMYARFRLLLALIDLGKIVTWRTCHMCENRIMFV